MAIKWAISRITNTSSRNWIAFGGAAGGGRGFPTAWVICALATAGTVGSEAHTQNTRAIVVFVF